jgi:hypothetical protein
MSFKNHQQPLVFSICTLVLACKPTVGQPPYLVTDFALLAVRGDPAEAKPGANVTYSYLLASPNGQVGDAGDADATWDVCVTPKPPAVSNAVSSACTQTPDSTNTTPGQTFAATIPTNACSLFGPIAPAPVTGQPPVRPRDPDSTGGYYLPVRVRVTTASAEELSGFAFERIQCNLASAPADAIQAYNSQYLPNNPPGIDHTDLVDATGTSLPLDSGPQNVTAGSLLTVEATFVDGSAETFPVYDPQSETLVSQQESLHMSWFVTGGTFEHDRTGVAAGEFVPSTSNQWTAPEQADTIYLWLVLRDSRGGIDYKGYQIQVVP